MRPKVKGGGRKLVRGKTDITDLLRGTDVEGLDLLPADFSYRHMDLALDDTGKPTRRLKRVLEPVAEHYDLAVLDCPPSISLVSESVFEAADTLLVPLIPSTLTMRTFEQLDEFVEERVSHPPEILAFFSMVDRRKRLHRQVVESFPIDRTDVARTAIPAATEVELMGVRRSPVVIDRPHSRAGRAYRGLWSRGPRPPRHLTRNARGRRASLGRAGDERVNDPDPPVLAPGPALRRHAARWRAPLAVTAVIVLAAGIWAVLRSTDNAEDTAPRPPAGEPGVEPRLPTAPPIVPDAVWLPAGMRPGDEHDEAMPPPPTLSGSALLTGPGDDAVGVALTAPDDYQADLAVRALAPFVGAPYGDDRQPLASRHTVYPGVTLAAAWRQWPWADAAAEAASLAALTPTTPLDHVPAPALELAPAGLAQPRHAGRLGPGRRRHRLGLLREARDDRVGGPPLGAGDAARPRPAGGDPRRRGARRGARPPRLVRAPRQPGRRQRRAVAGGRGLRGGRDRQRRRPAGRAAGGRRRRLARAAGAGGVGGDV